MRRFLQITPTGVLAGLLAMGGVAYAEGQATNTPLVLSAVLDVALRDNATLKSLRAKWEAMQQRSVQAGALANPMLTYGGMDMASGGSWPDTNEKRIMVQQGFPWSGKRGLREGIAAKDAEIMQRDVDAMTRDVVMMVKESFHDLYAVQQVIAVTRDEEAVVRRMENVAETLYAAGDRSQIDVLKARTELTLLKQKLLEAEVQETTLKAKLNMLLNRRADSPLGTAVLPPGAELSESGEALFALAAANRPELKAAQAQVERYELEQRLMSKEFLPDYALGLEYRDPGANEDMIMFTVSVELPVRVARVKAGVREAGKMRDSSVASLEALRRQVTFDVQDASFKLRTARRTLELYRRELIPQAEARFSASEAGYRTGKVDFMDLLESERFLLGVKVMAAMTEGTIGVQQARLERAVAVDDDKR